MKDAEIITGQDALVGPFVAGLAGGIYQGGPTIGVALGGKLVAGIRYDNFNGSSMCIHASSTVPMWLRPNVRWFMFHYPFKQLGIKKLLGFIDSGNRGCWRTAEKLGFRLEYVIADAGRDGDLKIYSMTRDECVWL